MIHEHNRKNLILLYQAEDRIPNRKKFSAGGKKGNQKMKINLSNDV